MRNSIIDTSLFSDSSRIGTPLIRLALTDDWELRGDGSGDIKQIQFGAMQELLRIFREHRARTTFNVEVMQQLTFRRLQCKHAELGRLADEWDEHVRDALRQGQDIQLHIHPQWSRADYVDGKWRLSGDWSLPNYSEETGYAMLAESKAYIENLLRPVDAAYRCVSFRSGSSSIAPSEFALPLLAKLGIVFDMSIIGGLNVNTRNLQIDYTDCEESFRPFYPRMNDARKVSSKREPIVCVPIFSFRLSRWQTSRQTLAKITALARRSFAAGRTSGEHDSNYAGQEWAEIGRSSLLMRAYDKAIKPSLSGKHMTADIGQLDYVGLTEMLGAIRTRARASGLKELPIILTNHSKYIKDFSHIERFIKDLSAAKDIRFATLTDIAHKLESGEFAIRTAPQESAVAN
jgi:hypothetical protein